MNPRRLASDTRDSMRLADSAGCDIRIRRLRDRIAFGKHRAIFWNNDFSNVSIRVQFVRCGLVAASFTVNVADSSPLRSMNARRLLTSLVLSGLGFCFSAFAEDKAPAASAPASHGYQVVLDLKVTEAGTVEDAKVVSSEDKSVDHILERTAMEMVRPAKFPPRSKDGKAVAYTARAPFNFAVDDDEGPEAASLPQPHIRNAVRPVFPEDLATKGEVGGVIFAMEFAADGSVKSLKTLRSSHPEFEQAALAALKQWSFNPAKKDGVPVESRGYLAIGFETDVLRPAWKWLFPPRPSVGYYAVVRRTLPDNPTTGATSSAPDAGTSAKPEPVGK